ncbi:MAG: 50S ribosomal protein L10 [Deltaproteobacteria bacterium]|nr:50S ribosomal protein L10 [Deltaproteobacteria bacterium]
MLKREAKEALVGKIHDKLMSAQAVFLVDYRGLKVSEINVLRQKLREVSSELEVVKNTLLRRAASGTPADALADHFSGPMALSVSQSDVVAPAKVLTTFSKEVPVFEIKAGLLDGRVLDVAEIKKLASLPSLPELRAIILGTLQAPAGSLLRVIAAPGNQIARAVALRKEQLAATGDGAAAEAEAPASA